MVEEATELIARLIREFEARHDAEDRILPTVRKHEVLPLFALFDAWILIRPDGELMWVCHPDQDPTPVDDPYLEHGALFVGVERHPELRGVLPKKPTGAVVCALCGGSGRPTKLPDDLPNNIFCQCGGAGWLPPELGKR